MEKQKPEIMKQQEKKSTSIANVPMKTQEEKRYEEKMVRLMSEDIEGSMKVYPALTKITGVSWGIANATCSALKLDKNRKVGSLTAEEIKQKTEFDIKRLKKIKSYRGVRHAAGQPVRGQRTKAHFRKNKTKGMGVKKRGKTEEKGERKEYVK